MTYSKILSFGIILAVMPDSGTVVAGTMPQDTWGYYGKMLMVPDSNQKKGVAVSSDAVFVGVGTTTGTTATTGIQKYTLAGAYVSTFSATFSDITGMACDTLGNLYVFDRPAASLKSFDPAGNLLWSKGGSGNGQEQFAAGTLTNQHGHLAVDENNRIYVVDQGNARIQVFDQQGNFQLMWGSAGTGAGQFQGAFGVAARRGQVMVVDSPGGNRQRIQLFTDAGAFVRTYGWPTLVNTIIQNERFAYSPDGLFTVATSGIGGTNQWPLFDQSLTVVGGITRPAVLPIQSSMRLGGAFLSSGDFCIVTGAEVWILERRHSSTDNPAVRNILPQPEVIKSVQRPASTLLDIDFKVLDPDSATVDVAALAFVNGGDTLADVLRVATLVEGTAANVGPGQAPNAAKRLTWNAAADWSTEFGEVQVEILAKDQRDLLGIHWIAVPASGATAAFEASAKPVEDSDFLSIWYWLIAKGDPEVALVNGEVRGVGGNYDGQVLASGTMTSPAGSAYLFGKLGVRAITPEELTSLQSGNYGFSSSNTRTVVRP